MGVCASRKLPSAYSWLAGTWTGQDSSGLRVVLTIESSGYLEYRLVRPSFREPPSDASSKNITRPETITSPISESSGPIGYVGDGAIGMCPLGLKGFNWFEYSQPFREASEDGSGTVLSMVVYRRGHEGVKVRKLTEAEEVGAVKPHFLAPGLSSAHTLPQPHTQAPSPQRRSAGGQPGPPGAVADDNNLHLPRRAASPASSRSSGGPRPPRLSSSGGSARDPASTSGPL